tara:strand:- start:175 stop:552 length:378 start_codon:yes stop_codon:yes gene_type:complete
MDALKPEYSKEYKIYYIQQQLSKDKSNKYFNILLNIITNHNLEYSTNKNGIFFNISVLDDDILQTIYMNFINSSDIESPQKKQPYCEKPIINKQKKISPKKLKDKLTLDKFDKYLLQQSKTTLHL